MLCSNRWLHSRWPLDCLAWLGLRPSLELHRALPPLTFGHAPALRRLTLGVVAEPGMAASTASVQIRITHCGSLQIINQIDMKHHTLSILTDYKVLIQRRRVGALQFLHTANIAVEMASERHVVALPSLLHW